MDGTPLKELFLKGKTIYQKKKKTKAQRVMQKISFQVNWLSYAED